MWSTATDEANNDARMSGGVRRFAGDVLELAELQLQLLRFEWSLGLRRMMAPTMLLVAATGLSLACLPIALAGVAFLLHEDYGWRLSACLFVVAANGLLASLFAAIFVKWIVGRRGPMFVESRREWLKNCRWVKRHLTPGTREN